ncbi:MAG: cell division protein ZapE [Pseudomonadota bacterium]
MMGDLLSAYRQKAEAGLIEFDPEQAEAIEQLAILNQRLIGWKPDNALFLFGRPEPTPKGLYIYGKVGRGKSMLMDLFFDAATIPKKMRIHFQEFMAWAHDEINNWRKLSESQRRNMPHYVRGAGDDPIRPVAKLIADKATLLCFDEFQITDIADAMILGRLFEALFERKCVIVATSNRAPREHYKDGINRELLLPFFARIENELDIISLDSKRDYRLSRLESEPTYFIGVGENAQIFADRAWDRLTFGAKGLEKKLNINGRDWTIKCAAAGCARFDFLELCGNQSNTQAALGTLDYLLLAKTFNTIIIENVPQLSTAQFNEAARFRNLIDALYEAKTKLIITMAAPPEETYISGTQSTEFERTASRLYEMRSHEYLVLEQG